jgi:hypothetical protein
MITFYPTLLVEMERSLLIRWVTLYAQCVDERRKEKTHVRARSPRRGVARRGEERGRGMCA